MKLTLETVGSYLISRALSGHPIHPVEVLDLALLILEGRSDADDASIAAALGLSLATVREHRRRYGDLAHVGDAHAPYLVRVSGTGRRGSRTVLRHQVDPAQVWIGGTEATELRRAATIGASDRTRRALRPVDGSARGCGDSDHPSRARVLCSSQAMPETRSTPKPQGVWGGAGAPPERAEGAEQPPATNPREGISEMQDAENPDSLGAGNDAGAGIVGAAPGPRSPAGGSRPRSPGARRFNPPPSKLVPRLVLTPLPTARLDRAELLAQAEQIRTVLQTKRRALGVRRVAPAWEIADGLAYLVDWLGSRDAALRCVQAVIAAGRRRNAGRQTPGEDGFPGYAFLFSIKPRQTCRAPWFREGAGPEGKGPRWNGVPRWDSVPGWIPVLDPRELSPEPLGDPGLWLGRWRAGRELAEERRERQRERGEAMDRSEAIATATQWVALGIPGGRIALAAAAGQIPPRAGAVLEAVGGWWDPLGTVRRWCVQLSQGSARAMRILTYLDAACAAPGAAWAPKPPEAGGWLSDEELAEDDVVAEQIAAIL